MRLSHAIAKYHEERSTHIATLSVKKPFEIPEEAKQELSRLFEQETFIEPVDIRFSEGDFWNTLLIEIPTTDILRKNEQGEPDGKMILTGVLRGIGQMYVPEAEHKTDVDAFGSSSLKGIAETKYGLSKETREEWCFVK